MLITWRVCAKLPHEPIIILKYRVSPTFGNGGLKCLDKIDGNPRENHLPFLRNGIRIVYRRPYKKWKKEEQETATVILPHFLNLSRVINLYAVLICAILRLFIALIVKYFTWIFIEITSKFDTFYTMKLVIFKFSYRI